tara:strand:+ start:19441 stop:20472 length:1032 start_codon:yes stop_codon:yes gene_type:complete
MKRALICPYRYDDFDTDWLVRMQWIANALEEVGYETYKHSDFKNHFDGTRLHSTEIKYDVAIYNHCDYYESLREDFSPEVETRWFFKPTVPDLNQSTLDELGYGSFSSITYDRPDYENVPAVNVDHFFNTKVKHWKENLSSKWGAKHFHEGDIPHRNFYLVVGQCSGDSVVTRQDFGGYFDKLCAVVEELSKVTTDKIIVKLHPYTNGPMHKKNNPDIKTPLKQRIQSISNNVIVYDDFTSIHAFLPHCKCVVVGNSGAGFEAMMYDKPIISFCHPEYHWVTYDLRKLVEINRAVDLSWYNRESNRKFLYWYMEEYCFFDQASAIDRVRELSFETIEYKTYFL